MGASLWQRLVQLLLPARCALCQRIGPDVLCAQCAANLEAVGELHCLRCGRRRHTPYASPDCAECHGQSLGVVRARSRYLYNEAGRSLLAEFKYKGNTGAGQVLARELADWAAPGWAALYDEPDTAIDLVVPVPLFAKRLRERRFNQAELLARHIGTRMQVPCRSEVLQRSRETPTQVGLSAGQRRENVRGAFSVPDKHRDSLSGRRVLLIDDLMTTGATLWSCSVALKRGGAAAVYGLTVFSTYRGVEPVG